MTQTVEAMIYENGRVSLAEPLHLPGRRRALLTIFEDDTPLNEDLAPARTHAEMAAAHRARRTVLPWRSRIRE